MPLITNDLSAMDTARLEMIDRLEAYIGALKDELKANELILAAIKASMAAADERASRQLDDNIRRPAIIQRRMTDAAE